MTRRPPGSTTARKVTATLTDPSDVTNGGGVESIAFGPHGILAAADGDGSIYLWDTTARKVTATLTDPPATAAGSLAFGPHATLATAAGPDCYLWHLTYHHAPAPR
jgi:WD40 repeat protein